MRILAIDPGETSGLVVLNTTDEGPPLLLDHWEGPTTHIEGFAFHFLHILQEVQPTAVVVENYRVYKSKASVHIGQPLHTAKLVGAIIALCAVVVPPVTTVVLEASKKGLWPDARLKAKFPDFTQVQTPHTMDALKLGLVYLEKEELWTP